MISFFRIISGLMGGVIGSFFMFILYLAYTNFFGSENTPITSFFLIFMVFIGSLIANLMTGVFFSLACPEKYSLKSTMLWQAFFINMFFFFIVFPFSAIISDL